MIGGRTMLDRVVERCKTAANYVNRNNAILTRVVIVTPEGDPIADTFASRCEIVQGPEHDVLTRYSVAVQRFEPNYIVRVTGDCPLIPSFIVSQFIRIAVDNRYDYLSNVDPRFRTSLDGEDCEVISKRLFDLVDKFATRPEDREHVTTMIRRSPPEWAKIGAVVGHFDHSSLKLSVDTPEDLERVRKAHDAAFEKYTLATRAFGQTAVHRL